MKYKSLFKSFSMISNDELLRGLSKLLQESRRVESDLVAHIGEVEHRRLFVRYASSMFTYATQVLSLSEHEAYLRIGVARAARKHPMLLEMLSNGRLHLSGIARLAPLLTEANRESVLARAAGKSKRKIEELAGELAPKEDVPATIRKLPDRQEKSKPNRSRQLVPERVEQENLDVETTTPSLPTAPAARPAVVKPIAPSRYKVAFTASAGLRDKLERLQALMRSSVPDGDLATVIEEAVTEKIERLESKRFGKTKAPRKSLETTDTSATSRYIPAAVTRTVHKRDRGQCAYIDPNGRRCAETERLEFHHHKPFGRGGDHSVGNIQLACRTHNGYYAERDYGKEMIERYRIKRRSGSRVSKPVAVYTFFNRATPVLQMESPFP